MKIIYVANDGKQFDNEVECLSYEWLQDHPLLSGVEFLDENGDRLYDLLSEDTYNNVVTIIIPNANVYREFRALARYTGYCAYADIDYAGTWVWNNRAGNFELM